ncbi:glycosyltransferase family 2 protein [Bradyrhizobium sp. sBnM-33]|jgi:glycosyltransferase involved in cell wall biosynthesis|uniref:glycosyltransferase family 2 protein n=1 Tax=Bradyrhizobium sp. sBnM-33 TaxID=2831780 RepID=UPI001BCADB49|nr:glycosyltransferase family 2 protein [Bradyrhizobium sp. sBnM-33]WOH53655.1 glycosyltransferase family 2 protein [Bradyrhizobium sp. sBnM-33]
MPDSPKLAVVISCYNYEPFVERAIRSVLNQTRGDCEVVVVDDGSTDGSWEVISRTGVTAFRIENSGARLACLFGLDRTRAPFVLFLDADDELKPAALGKIIDRLDPDVAKLQFPLTRIDADGNVISGAVPSLETFRDRDVLARQVLRSSVYKSPPTSGNVFRRDLCELLREADYDKFVDGVILFAAPFLGDVVSISEELGCYRIHGRNDSGLGRMPDAGSLERDINRFLARMEHLRTILQRLEPGQELVDPRESFYFREQRFHLQVASGQRPRLTALPGLVAKLLGEPISMKNKLAMAVYFILASMLPNDRGKALLAYRLKTGQRTALGFAKEIIGRGAPLRN